MPRGMRVSRICLLSVVILGGAAATNALAAQGAGADLPRAGVTDAAAPGGLLEACLFYLAAAAAVGSALGVCVARNIVRMAIFLFGALGAVAMLYFLLAANFIAAIQLIVYVGGTLILLIFGVMLTSKSPWVRYEPRKIEYLAAGLVCAALIACLVVLLRGAVWHSAEGVVPGAAMEDFGRSLLTRYLVPFEVAGILLMIVMVGAAHLARQDK